ncbi:hypothetical protein D3C80_1489380 [compost metagenome]
MGLFKPLPTLCRQAVVQQLFAMPRKQRTIHTNRQHHRAEAHRRTHARGHAGAFPRHAGHDVLLRIAIEQSRAGTRHGNRQGEGQVTAAIDRPGAEQITAAHQGESDGHHVCRRHTSRQACTNARKDQHGHGKRQHAQPGGNGGKT